MTDLQLLRLKTIRVPSAMRVFVFICLLLLLERTTAASYENIGTGLCACQNHERKNGLDLCSSEVFLGYGPYARPKLSEGTCVKLCDFAEDCAAYQYDGNCVLYLWGRPPAGVLDVGAIRERGPSGLARVGLERWSRRPCMRKMKGELASDNNPDRYEANSPPSLFNNNIEWNGRKIGTQADFAVMPHERILKKENQFTQEEKFKKGKAGHQRICTCESRDIDEVEEDIMKSRKKFIIGRRGREQTVPYRRPLGVCRVADERSNMSTEAAKSECLMRNRRAEKEGPGRIGCAGFLSFSSLSAHPQAERHRSVLFFAGGQTVTGIAASNSEYKKKGGPRNSPLKLYLQKDDTYTERIVGDGFHAHTDSSVLGGLYPAANIDQPRCVYYVGDRRQGEGAASSTPSMSSTRDPEPDPAAASPPPAPAPVPPVGNTTTTVDGNLEDAERVKILFNVAVVGAAVFSVALLVVAGLLVAACRKYKNPRRAVRSKVVGKDRQAKQNPLSGDQTRRDGPAEVAARVQQDEKGPQPPTPPVPVPKDKLATPTGKKQKESTEKKHHGWAPPWQRRAGAPSARQGRDLAEGVDRGFPTRYADYRLDVRDQQPLPTLQGHHSTLQGPTQERQALMGLQLESHEGAGEVPLPLNPHAHSIGKGGSQGAATSGRTHQVPERATGAAA